MASANFTGEGKQQTFEQLVCSASFTAEIHHELTIISALNIFLSITAFLGNVLILAALRKETSLHSPSKLLLRSLAATDLCVGLMLEPLFVAHLMSLVDENLKICRFMLVVGFTTKSFLYSVSVLTLAAISVDRLLALLLGLRYRQVVTLKRTCVIVIIFWVVSTVFSTMHFWNKQITVWYNFAVTFLCLVISIFSYTKIFFTIRHRQNQVQGQAQQPNQANQLNIARYRKAVYSVLWLQLALVACYLPIGVVGTLSNTSELTSHVFLAQQCAVTLVFFNSSLNPILYCWKIDEVRQAVKDTIRQILCFSSG